MRSRALRSAFLVLYGPGARIYDTFTRAAFAGEWQRWQASALRALPTGGIIVELGSGTGDFAVTAAASFHAWIGLDISQQMIAVAKRHHRPPAPMFVKASAAAVPLRGGMADAVVATFPSNYIFERSVAAEVRRVLKTDGRLVVILSGELNPSGVRRRCARAVAGILHGRTVAVEQRSFAVAGFVGHSQWQTTEFGRALVYIGTPSSIPVDGCSQRFGDVGGREPVRLPD